MKIDVTYEKADILRLVQADLEAKGIRVKGGVEYKGALSMKLSVDTDDAVPSPRAPVPENIKTGSAAPPEADMSAILQRSGDLSKATKGKFERVLGPNESLEYPKDE